MTSETIERPDFVMIESNGGKFTFTWNWLSFVFGPIWYVVKGMWAKAIIYFTVGFIVGGLTAGWAAIPIWIAFGVLGNYDLYLFQRLGLQLWPQAVTGAPVRQSDPTSDFEQLKRLRDQGLLSDDEYSDKRERLVRSAENASALSALDQALNRGVLTQSEYDHKRDELLSGR